MAQTPAGLAARSIAPPPAPQQPRERAADPVLQSIPRLRICVLCGHPLRTGQHLTRVQGSTIHARCRSSSR
jgi:hypothetical protein